MIIYIFYTVMWVFLSCFSFSLQSTSAILQSGAGSFVIAPTTITQPGTYKLSQNINGNITIAASDVVLDLNNFQILPPSGVDAIDITSQTDITIKNGTISGGNNGVFLTSCQRITVENITFLNQADVSVLLNGSSYNKILNNAFSGGMSAAIGIPNTSVSINNIINGNFISNVVNSGGTGILVSGQCNLVENNIISLNTLSISIFDQGTNTYIINNIVSNNSGQGISAANPVVMNNTVSFNTETGIIVGSAQAVFNNTAQQNGTNYSGVSAATIITYSLSGGTYSATPFDSMNLSITT